MIFFLFVYSSISVELKYLNNWTIIEISISAEFIGILTQYDVYFMDIHSSLVHPIVLFISYLLLTIPDPNDELVCMN